MRKFAIALAVTAALAVGLGAPAIAQYGGNAPGLSDLSGTPEAANVATGAAGSCTPGDPVSLTIDGVEVAVGTTNADGSFSLSFTNPTQPGSYVLRVECQ